MNPKLVVGIAHFLLVIIMAIWAVHTVLSKLALDDHFNAFIFSLFRFFGGFSEILCIYFFSDIIYFHI
jgi:hypothetical protein